MWDCGPAGADCRWARGDRRVGQGRPSGGPRLTGPIDLLLRVTDRPLSEEWEAQADAWARWTRTPGHDHPLPAIVFMALQDMDDARAAVSEAARVLAPGGRCVAAFVHPFASAHLGRMPEERRSYFEVQRTLDEVERNGIAFAFHQIHRPLEESLGMFLDAGFRIEAVREPRPSEADVEAVPRLAESRRKPAFLHLRCER